MTNEKRNSLNKVEQKKASTSRRERRKRVVPERGICTEEKGLGTDSPSADLAAYHSCPAVAHRRSDIPA